jgi:hypothetical protein
MNRDQSNENEKEIVPPPSASTPEAPALPASPEEQMARFEEALKEEDWGHQPC